MRGGGGGGEHEPDDDDEQRVAMAQRGAGQGTGWRRPRRRGGRDDGEGDDTWDSQQGHFSLFTVLSHLSS